jgi:hypothetical protein
MRDLYVCACVCECVSEKKLVHALPVLLAGAYMCCSMSFGCSCLSRASCHFFS